MYTETAAMHIGDVLQLISCTMIIFNINYNHTKIVMNPQKEDSLTAENVTMKARFLALRFDYSSSMLAYNVASLPSEISNTHKFK